MAARMLSLTKGGHKYVFHYSAGCEEELVDQIMHLAEDPQTNLDWLDAATLSFQVARYSATDGQDALTHAGKAQD